ncbi:hypothetical protein Lal_00014563 [Lupinus albus]|nr:hypothetical protein Lal_00014563 [Lupinus albus]
MIKIQAEANVPTEYGNFRMIAFSENDNDWMPQMALVAENTDFSKPVNVRFHSECITGEVFHSKKCECGQQLDAAMKYTQENGGAIVYLRQEGRNIGIINKLKAYALQEKGFDTVQANLQLGLPADDRDFNISAESGYSVSTLQRYFNVMLGKVPKLSYRQNKEVYLLIDGTYFSNEICLVVYRDNVFKQTQLYRITDGEHYEELKEDLENILNLGIKIGGITCDGDKSLLKAIRKVCPKVPVQRCLVHIQRMCKIWLSAYPKSEAGFELHEIVCKLHFIDNEVKKQYWIKEFLDWFEKYKDFLNEKSYSLETGRYCVDCIAGKLLLSIAYFLFQSTAKYYELFL